MMHSCCFVFANLLCLFNFVAVSCHMATGPHCLQTVICSEARDVRLIVDPFFRKQSDKLVTFVSAGPTFCLRSAIRAGNKIPVLSLFSPIIASYCNKEEWGWQGDAYTPGNIKTDSALCALMEKTIKNNYNPGFNTVSLFLFLSLLNLGFPLSWPVKQLKRERWR